MGKSQTVLARVINQVFAKRAAEKAAAEGRKLDPDQLEAITAQAKVRHVSEGEFVHRKGDKAETFYVEHFVPDRRNYHFHR